MPKSKSITIIWTDRALQNAVSVKKYLHLTFSNKEIENFYSLLEAFEIAVSAFPELYPASSIKRGVRRAVLSKVLSVFYRITKNKIEVLAIFDNRCNIERWL